MTIPAWGWLVLRPMAGKRLPQHSEERKVGRVSVQKGALSVAWSFGFEIGQDPGRIVASEATNGKSRTIGGFVMGKNCARVLGCILVFFSAQLAIAEGDPCAPNPCTSPPSGECDVDGVTLLTYLPEGTCTDIGGGSFACEYTPTSTDCSAQGTVCEDGACVVGLPVPAVSTWGLGAMALLVLAAGTVVMTRRKAVA